MGERERRLKHSVQALTPASVLVEKYNWRRVEAPKAWVPKVGEELVGFYAGRSLRNGVNGQYEVVLVAIPGGGMRMVSGVQIVQLIDAAMVDLGAPIRIVYEGTVTTALKREMKQFEMMVTEGERVPVEDLPGLPEAEH